MYTFLNPSARPFAYHTLLHRQVLECLQLYSYFSFLSIKEWLASLPLLHCHIVQQFYSFFPCHSVWNMFILSFLCSNAFLHSCYWILFAIQCIYFIVTSAVFFIRQFLTFTYYGLYSFSKHSSKGIVNTCINVAFYIVCSNCLCQCIVWGSAMSLLKVRNKIIAQWTGLGDLNVPTLGFQTRLNIAGIVWVIWMYLGFPNAAEYNWPVATAERLCSLSASDVVSILEFVSTKYCSISTTTRLDKLS